MIWYVLLNAAYRVSQRRYMTQKPIYRGRVFIHPGPARSAPSTGTARDKLCVPTYIVNISET